MTYLSCLNGVQRSRFHGKWQYLFIESICNDPDVLEQNYRYKMMYSPDYKLTNADAVSDAQLQPYPHTLYCFCSIVYRNVACLIWV